MVLTHNRLEWKFLPNIDTTAYYDNAKITAVKSSTAPAQGLKLACSKKVALHSGLNSGTSA
jgi:hypothetical protein